jgi:2-amino-4-hydroxy-6-hydroxymethyldihydropteridine diphosphokinase
MDAAVAELGQNPRISILAASPWRESRPVGGPADQPLFLNGAIRIETSLNPHELLACLAQIEDRLGRRRQQRWGPRAIDLDLLLYDELILNTPTLVLPHPRMAWRRFVIEPAAEVAGDMLHPTTRWTISRLLEHLNTAPPYVAITGAIAAGKTQLAQRLSAAVSSRLVLEQPDWPLLDAFYTNPSGHAWQTELEFLHHRTRLLADQPASSCSSSTPPHCNGGAFQNDTCWSEKGDSPHLPERPRGCFAQMGTVPFFRRWTVSDFWFDQSAAFARAWLPEEQLPLYMEEYEKSRHKVVRPKLIVLLDSPAERLLDCVRRRGRQCERPLTAVQLDRIRRAVREQVERPDVGPVLHAAGDDPETAFTEVLAAVQGME